MVRPASTTAEATAAQPQQDHAELAALDPQVVEPGQYGHLPAVHDARAARGHPRPADLLGDLGAPFDQAQDLRVQIVDLLPEHGDLLVGRDLGARVLDGHCGHVLLLYPAPRSERENAPGPLDSGASWGLVSRPRAPGSGTRRKIDC